MAESPSTMSNIEHIRGLLDELIDREAYQTETLAAIQNEILAAIKGVEKAIENLYSPYRSMREEATGKAHRAACERNLGLRTDDGGKLIRR